MSHRLHLFSLFFPIWAKDNFRDGSGQKGNIYLLASLLSGDVIAYRYIVPYRTLPKDNNPSLRLRNFSRLPAASLASSQQPA